MKAEKWMVAGRLRKENSIMNDLVVNFLGWFAVFLPHLPSWTEKRPKSTTVDPVQRATAPREALFLVWGERWGTRTEWKRSSGFLPSSLTPFFPFFSFFVPFFFSFFPLKTSRQATVPKQLSGSWPVAAAVARQEPKTLRRIPPLWQETLWSEECRKNAHCFFLCIYIFPLLGHGGRLSFRTQGGWLEWSKALLSSQGPERGTQRGCFFELPLFNLKECWEIE